MLSFLTGLRTKLSLVMGGIIAVLLAFIGIQSRSRKRLEIRFDKERQDRMRELYEQHKETTDAMVEGLDKEREPVWRGYFDSRDDQ